MDEIKHIPVVELRTSKLPIELWERIHREIQESKQKEEEQRCKCS